MGYVIFWVYFQIIEFILKINIHSEKKYLKFSLELDNYCSKTKLPWLVEKQIFNKSDLSRIYWECGLYKNLILSKNHIFVLRRPC